jgi:hypothetical protein
MILKYLIIPPHPNQEDMWGRPKSPLQLVNIRWHGATTAFWKPLAAELHKPANLLFNTSQRGLWLCSTCWVWTVAQVRETTCFCSWCMVHRVAWRWSAQETWTVSGTHEGWVGNIQKPVWTWCYRWSSHALKNLRQWCLWNGLLRFTLYILK